MALGGLKPCRSISHSALYVSWNSSSAWRSSSTVAKNRTQIVCTQSTKRLPLAVWAGGEHIADLNSAVRDNDPVDQEFEQHSLALEVRSRQAVPHASAEGLGMAGELGCFRVPVGIGQ